MQNFQDIEHFVKTLSAAIKKKIPTKVSQLTNDAGYKTTDTNTTYKLSKSGSTVTLTGSDGSTTSVTDSNTTYSSLKNPYSLTIQNNGTTVASYDGSTAKTANFTNVTTSANGLMSAADKSKLDGIGAGSNVKSVNGKTGVVNLSKADVGLGNVDNTRDADKPFYKLGGYDHEIGNCKWNDARKSLYKIRNFYAISGEGDYFYLAHKKHGYTITTTKHFSGVNSLFTSSLSDDCYVRTDLCSEADPAILTIASDATITATDVLTLLFIQHTGGADASRFNHWKLEILAAYDSSRNYPNATVTWKAGDWITVFERTNVSDIPNGLYCYLNPYRNNGVSFIYIKGIRLTIYAATPRSQKSGGFGYNSVPIGRLSLLDSRPSFSPAEALGALDVAGGTVYGKTTFQEGISATSFSGATATSSADGLMSKSDKSKLDGIGAGSNVKSVNSKTGAVTLTKSDIGLSNVDNTADSAKSVKYATSAGSANSVAWGNVSGKPSTYPPSSHTHTPAQVGLGNVANLDQSKAIKSITRSGTTFTATALDGTKTTFTQQDTNTTYGVATSSTDGLMSKTDKAKLDGISSGADAVTIKTVKVNGTALTPDSNKAVNVPVPKLANNATTTASGMALDARMGKTLSDQIASVKTGAIDQIVNLTAAGWTGDTAPYSQTVNVTGMTDELLCELFSACPKSATVAEREAYNEAFALVASGYAETADGSATFLVDEKPTIDIGVRIKSISKANAVSDQTSEDVTNAVDAMSNTLWEKIYPVGSIYISANSTSPAELFGGTWEQIKDRFLLAAGDTYEAGSTGGEATHTHKYGFQYGAYFGSISMERDAQSGVLQGGTGDPVGSAGVAELMSDVNNNVAQATKTLQMTHYKSIADTSSASNMPPYLTVYMWKRVS